MADPIHEDAGAESLAYQVIWEDDDDKARVLSSHNQGYISHVDNTLSTISTHHINIQHCPPQFVPKAGCSNVCDSTESIIETAEDLIDNERETQYVTEISSFDCQIRGRKKKKLKTKDFSEDQEFENEGIVLNKNLKLKKDKTKEENVPAKKRFSRNWYQIPEFSKWLEESPIPGYAFCNVCRKDLQPGKSELLKHCATVKHKRKIEAIGRGTKDDPLDHRVIDLRSDTVTVPNRDMRDAIKNAVVGDLAFGEDPTVNELEKKVAKLLGKEAGIFLPSGTMANLIAVLSHCWSRGSLVILGDESHLYRASQGSLSEIGNVSQRVVRNLPDGTFELQELKNLLRMHGPTWPSMTLVCVENTHSKMGGKPISLQWMDSLGTLCEEYGIPIHLDGARLINASVALGTIPAKLARRCSSATFCLNKGLGAPGGSILAGSADYIQRASVIRKSLGGMIHQSGILAAAGLYGLDNLVPRISKDHSNARAIAKAVCGINSSAVVVDVNSVQTNIIHLICDNIRVNPEQLGERLKSVFENEALDLGEGTVMRCTSIEPNIVRLVTHGDLTNEDIRGAIRKLQFVISEYDNYFVISYDATDEQI